MLARYVINKFSRRLKYGAGKNDYCTNENRCNGKRPHKQQIFEAKNKKPGACGTHAS